MKCVLKSTSSFLYLLCRLVVDMDFKRCSTCCKVWFFLIKSFTRCVIRGCTSCCCCRSCLPVQKWRLSTSSVNHFKGFSSGSQCYSQHRTVSIFAWLASPWSFKTPLSFLPRNLSSSCSVSHIEYLNIVLPFFCSCCTFFCPFLSRFVMWCCWEKKSKSPPPYTTLSFLLYIYRDVSSLTLLTLTMQVLPPSACLSQTLTHTRAAPFVKKVLIAIRRKWSFLHHFFSLSLTFWILY